MNRDENALTFVNGTPSLPGFGGDIDASTLRLAAFAQDEWTVSKAVSANAGLRWESIRTQSRLDRRTGPQRQRRPDAAAARGLALRRGRRATRRASA